MGDALESRLHALEEANLNRSIAQAADLADMSVSLDVVWLLTNGFLVFLMQVGFCMLEAGAVSSRSTEAIMMKNACDCCVTALVWWAVGYTFAFGDGSPFIGVGPSGLFFASGIDDAYTWAAFFFHLNFCATASTIVSGAIAERAHILSYLLFSLACGCIIYPVVAHWQWSTSGWASPSNPNALLGGVIDFAGGGAVHVLGGVASLCGAAIIGPRKGRFDPTLDTGDPGAATSGVARISCCKRRTPQPMPGHSSVLIIMGTFMLWVGWYGFNAGSTMHMDASHGTTAARVAVTTTLAASAGGMASVLTRRFGGRAHSWEVQAMCNGTLAGLVSITSGCATVDPWAAVFVGAIGGVVQLKASAALLRMGIDDPLDAAAVHGTGGVWAVLSAALLSTDTYTADVYGASVAPGLIYPGANGDRLGAALVFLLATIVWVGGTSTFIFSSLNQLGILRAPERLDEVDIDMDASRVGGVMAGAVGVMLQGAGIAWEPPVQAPGSNDGSPAGERRGGTTGATPSGLFGGGEMRA